MTSPHVLLRCGCTVPFADGTAPVCASHGDTGIARTLHMPAPRIRGVASGPHVHTLDLSPHMARIAGSEPVKGSPRG